MDTIVISDLEVRFRVGVTEEERRYPQRLLVSLELEHDFSAAAASDLLDKTIDYFALAQILLNSFSTGKEWKLIEKLAADIAEMILSKFQPASVKVELKKFTIPEARFVGVRLTRARG